MALYQRDYAQAQLYYKQALQYFQAAGDLMHQAIAWHQLSVVAEKWRAWAEAEQCCRESLMLAVRIGNLKMVIGACDQLAIIAEGSGRPVEAEGWLKGALERIERVQPGEIIHFQCLENLARLLVNEVRAGHADKVRLADARHYLEQVQRIEEQAIISAERWGTYKLLAEIAELEGHPDMARDYSWQERESFAAFAGNRAQIDRQHLALILITVNAAQGDTQAQAVVTAELPTLEENGWQVSEGIQRIWNGERDWRALAEGLVNNESALLLLRVVETLTDPQPFVIDPLQVMEIFQALLPSSILAALEQENEAVLQQTLEAFPLEQQQLVTTILEVLRGQ